MKVTYWFKTKMFISEATFRTLGAAVAFGEQVKRNGASVVRITGFSLN